MANRDGIVALEQAVSAAVLGQAAVIRHVLVALLADGHVLLESLPGLAKTRTVKALAAHLDATMRRIQFTPDLLPSDITGADVLQQDADGRQRIEFQQGPLFGNLVLADEINRAPAKVQSALLEAMEERQITVGGVTRPMAPLFMVLATQNPIEQEGTYPLPEAQMDRFLMKIRLDYPAADDEIAMLALLRAAPSPTRPARRGSRRRNCSPAGTRRPPCMWRRRSTATSWTWSTRRGGRPTTTPSWAAGYRSAPARAAPSRWTARRAHGWLAGADFSSPDDVRAVAHPVLRHRLHLSYDAVADGVTAEQVIDRLLDTVAVPA